MLMFECHPQLCPAGDKCNNQRFEKRLYPRMVPFLTKDKGWGLKTLDDIKEGLNLYDSSLKYNLVVYNNYNLRIICD